MGTQTQDPNRQQPGTDKKAPQDPKLNPERDDQNRGQQRTDQNQQNDQSGSRKRSSVEKPDSEDDDDSMEQPGQGGAIDQDKSGNRGGNR